MKRTATLLILLLAIASCKKEPTVWESDWSAPIINDTLSLANLVNDSTLAENAGFYELNLDRTLFSLNVADVISIPDTTIVETTSFSGSINLAPNSIIDNSIDEHSFDLDEVQLKTVILKSGNIDLYLENPLPTKMLFTVNLPGVTLNSVPYSQEFIADAGTTTSPGITEATIDLSDYQLDLTGISGGDYNILKSQVVVKTDPLGPTVTMTAADIVRVEATFRDVLIKYARGYFGSPTISDTTDVFLEIMNKVASGTIDLPSTDISFEIENGIKVTAEGELTTVSNENQSGNIVTLTGGQVGSSFNIDAATGSWSTLTPSVKTISFNSGNSNIEEYIENLGANHTLGYNFQMNPWGNVSGGWDELFENSTLNIRMRANMPLLIGVDNLVLRDTFAIELVQDPNKTRITKGELILQASNAFPISGTIKLIFRNANGVILHTVQGSQELRSALYGSFDPEHNLMVAGSELRFVLPEDVVADINLTADIIVETSFNTINPATNMNEPMSIPVGAFLAIKLKTKLTSENKF
ncbi:MAG: hypothetical protein QNK23_03035 [Crocinitomicaceae bacterium]|nr:hypothetical protein [Crocinitomicaceae bacterium]